ncbi:MFS general substrate transporter [Aulographum hederae CBS 113979]|uniref:MFS general substrate transporter n=1 Tax=Aulographum hederae CBS 113979 TaxID=1176131 RepID=A0A6G1H743_9PEZI|nr:MFS general substrate transporter [Aulographum hederae CBS 113979]
MGEQEYIEKEVEREQDNVLERVGSTPAIDRDRADSTDDTEEGGVPKGSNPDLFPITDFGKGLVGWDSQEDAQNPQNWGKRKKLLLMTLMSIMSTLAPLTSTLFAPSISTTMTEFSTTTPLLGTIMITIFMLGFGLGPLLMGPLSEIHGRYPIVVGASWFFNAWLLGCSFSPSMAGLIVMRLLAGVGGSAVMVLAPAVVADLYPVDRRATFTAVIVLAQCLGPVVGPIAGGFIAMRLGWRWGYWILLAANGLSSVVLTLTMKESCAIVLLERKTQVLRKETGREELASLLQRKMNNRELLMTSMVRPIKMLGRSPMVFLISMYVATIYGLLFLWFTTIPMVFQETYGWSQEATGLAYIGVGVGMMTSLAIIIKTNDATVSRLRKKNNGVFEPEMRLAGAVYFAVFVPISLFWYGWVTEYKVHWIVAVIGMAPFGFGMLGVFLPCQTYVVDAFPLYGASGVAAFSCMRSMSGVLLPLAGTSLYDALGLGWGNSLLGFIALLMVPIPIVFRRYGGTIRRKYPVTL